jgi:hypothetical protein
MTRSRGLGWLVVAMVLVPGAAQAGLCLAGARVSAPDVVGITFCNPGAGAVTPTAGEVYTVWMFRG